MEKLIVEWILVKDKLPNAHEDVLTVDMNKREPSPSIALYWIGPEKQVLWVSDDYPDYHPTHWMHLPKLPKNKEKV